MSIWELSWSSAVAFIRRYLSVDPLPYGGSFMVTVGGLSSAVMLHHDAGVVVIITPSEPFVRAPYPGDMSYVAVLFSSVSQYSRTMKPPLPPLPDSPSASPPDAFMVYAAVMFADSILIVPPRPPTPDSLSFPPATVISDSAASTVPLWAFMVMFPPLSFIVLSDSPDSAFRMHVNVISPDSVSA